MARIVGENLLTLEKQLLFKMKIKILWETQKMVRYFSFHLLSIAIDFSKSIIGGDENPSKLKYLI
jgi:hypothetical protein